MNMRADFSKPPEGVAEDVHENAYDLADNFSHLFGCDNRERYSLTDEIAKAIQAERDQWAGTVDDATENGAAAERARCAEIVKTWAAGLRGSEYLSRSTAILVSKIESGA